MTIEQIKKYIPIERYLSKIGFEPVTQKGDYLHYHSPLREDKKPSFWVNVKTQRFGDFADENATGDLIDLYKMVTGISSSIDAKRNLEDAFRLGSFSFVRPAYQPKERKEFKLSHTQPLQNRALVQYLESRGISLDTAKHCGVEEGYRGKMFWVIFRNSQGGYACRNGMTNQDGTTHQYAKISTNPQGITTIRHNSDTAVVFEGFINYLSAEEYWHCKTGQYIPYDIFVLNSTQNRKYADFRQYKQIKCFLDNDFNKPINTGLQCFMAIQKEYPQAVNLSSAIFPKYNDFNDYWIDYKRNLQKI